MSELKHNKYFYPRTMKDCHERLKECWDSDTKKADEIYALKTKLHQAEGALGYPVPGDIPEGTYKCGLCDAKNREIMRYKVEIGTLKYAFENLCEGSAR